MAKTAAQRRAARKRKEQERARRRPEQAPPGRWPGPGSEPGLFEQVQRLGTEERRRQRIASLIGRGAVARDGDELAGISAELAALDPDVDSAGVVTPLLMSLLAGLWEHGWQPADAAHVVRRQGRPRGSRLALWAIAGQAVIADAATLAPGEWQAQLDALELPSGHPEQAVTLWRLAEGLSTAEAWAEVLRLVQVLDGRGELPRLCPPPSQWRRGAARRPAGETHHADPRALGRIRGLLAKAESTDFPEEAEALTAKAQDLITRYAVDEAVLDAERGTSLTDQVSNRRVHLENPYPEAKVRLLDAVASANGARVIFLESLGIATVVGLPVDLDLVDLLFTSLLVQATRAMAAAGRAGGRGTRSPSFRRSFLMSYAARIRERLTEARDSATEEASTNRGAALVPVMRQRQEAVDDVFDRLFPDTYAVRTKAWNAHGWHAGRLAAETADLGSGREQVGG